MRTDPREMLAVGMLGADSRIGERIETLLSRGRTLTARASISTVVPSAIALVGLMIAGALAPHWIAFAQTGPAKFEVASVKRSTSSSTDGRINFTPGRMTAENMPLRFIITYAYNIRDYQLLGAPGWVESERYEISAKADGRPEPDQLRPMLQALLEERFRLKVHRSVEERSAYLMLPAKGGLKLPESRADCAALADERPAKGKSSFQCGSWFASDDQFTGMKISMAQFGEWLAGQVEGPVVDRTGYTGTFDIRLKWSRDDQPDSPGAAPAIYTVVLEQMGVKIESGKGPVEMLTVDHVERPDAN